MNNYIKYNYILAGAPCPLRDNERIMIEGWIKAWGQKEAIEQVKKACGIGLWKKTDERYSDIVVWIKSNLSTPV